MARKLDAKAIEARRVRSKADRSGAEREKQYIRDGFENNRINQTTVEIKPEPLPFSEYSEKIRVAAYCRVSTAEEQQAGSFEAQVQHFTQVIESNPNWISAGIFSDEGISGTSIQRRKGFQRMIEAARRHEIDRILCKSISRFGRNTVDVKNNLRLLGDLNPPVTVFFEQEGISSEGRNSLLITILSAVAELESQQKSEAVKSGIRYRMQQGIYRFNVKNTLGYYRDHFGRIKIEPTEAEIVKYIYESFLEGSSVAEIAEELTLQGITSPKGLFVWRDGTIRSILRNEKYYGAALMQKTVTKDFLTHKQVKNVNIISQFFTENHHEAIIPKEQWCMAQDLLGSQRGRSYGGIRKFTRKYFFPIIKSGNLKGFYILDCKWTKAERESFLKIIESIQTLNEEKER